MQFSWIKPCELKKVVDLNELHHEPRETVRPAPCDRKHPKKEQQHPKSSAAENGQQQFNWKNCFNVWRATQHLPEGARQKEQQERWEDLALMLNSCSEGPSKNVTQWQKCWASIKSNVKAMATKAKLHTYGTGGGSPAKPLTTYEQRVLDSGISTVESVIWDNSLPEAGFSNSPADNHRYPCNV